jgi:hypothetical protein
VRSEWKHILGSCFEDEFRKRFGLTSVNLISAIAVIGEPYGESIARSVFDDPNFPIIGHDRIADHDVHHCCLSTD